MAEIIKKIDNIYYLQIGVQGENLANAIQFDMSDWIAEHPSAHIYVLFKPYNSNVPSPVTTQLDENILTWRPSYTATAVTGVGYTEVRAIDPDTGLVKKSRIIPTSVENSVSGTDGEDPPSPFEEWVNQVLAAADVIQDDYTQIISNVEQAGGLMSFSVDNNGDLWLWYYDSDDPPVFEITDGDLYYVLNEEDED